MRKSEVNIIEKSLIRMLSAAYLEGTLRMFRVGSRSVFRLVLATCFGGSRQSVSDVPAACLRSPQYVSGGGGRGVAAPCLRGLGVFPGHPHSHSERSSFSRDPFALCFQ